MALGVCIPDLIAQGKITGDRAAQAQQIYDELVLQYERRFGRDSAEAMATKQTVDALERDLLNRKRQTLLQAKAQARIEYQARMVFDGGAVGDGVIDGRAMLAHLVRDEKARGVQNVEFRWHNIKQSALARLYDLLAAHRADLIGNVRNRAELEDVTRELFGQDTGNANAKELAGAWRDTAEFLRQRFNAAGGTIGKLEGWALPQGHDPMRVGAVSRREWIDAIVPMLDRSKMLDDLTGMPMGDGKLELVLADVYESIVSDGWNSRSPGAMGQKSIGNRHAEHRVLHFRDADGWMAYQDRFGAGTAFDAMMGHLEILSRDIATMEILGPNPGATIRWMQDKVTKDAAERGTLTDRGRGNVSAFQIGKVWDEIQGKNRRIVGRKLALFGSTLRNWQTSTRLGSATLASMSDHATRAIVRGYNGLPQVKMMGQYLKQLNPLDATDRDFARRGGIIGDEFTGRMAAHGRLHFEEAFGGRLSAVNAGWSGKLETGLENANEVSRRMADGVLRVSGLNAHTVAGREAMGMEFMNAITSYAGQDFDQLNGAFRGFLERYGMGREDWDRMRASPRESYKGDDWITPDSIAQGPGGQALRDRFMEAMLSEIEFAIPTGGLYMRSMVHFAPPGTIIGELIRTGFQFKMFPVTVMALHGGRMMAQASVGKRALYASAFLGTTTLAGALSYQLGEVAKGKDPRPMTDRAFWWRAMLKGGGLGIFGDAIELGMNDYGQTVGDVTKGPSYTTVQTVMNAGRAASASIGASTPEEEAAAGRLRGRAATGLLREVPGSSLWYVRAAYERLVIDQLAAWADPNYVERQRSMEDRAAETGQGYWMPPGGSPRMPDLGNALAEAPAQ